MSSQESSPQAARDHHLDVAALARFMAASVDGFAGAMSVAPFTGGQSNPTFRLTAGHRHYVLRKKPEGVLLPSAHAVDREYRVMAALATSGVPVPRMLAFCADSSVIGTPFYIMEHVEGRIFWDPALPGLTRDERRAHFDALNRVIATLHSVDYAAVGLDDFGRHGQYIARQIARWSKQYAAAGIEPIPAMDRLLAWLPTHIPDDDETRIVHGDYRIDNVIFHPTEPRILAVLDWELATLGHPLSDFAYHVMVWRLKPSEFRGIAGHDLEALGIPSEHDYVADYCRRTGRSGIPDFEFYLIFSMFRIAAILHGVLARARQGTAASADAIATGGQARVVADVAWNMARRIDA